MVLLVAPDPGRHDAWRSAMLDLADGPIDGSGFHGDAGRDTSASGFETYVADRLAMEDPATELAVGLVHCSFRWIVEDSWTPGDGGDGGDGQVLGFLAVRHDLTPWLLDFGGHVGYSVRPAARRRGVATAALAASLPVAAGLDIERVLVTCDERNAGSRATIEKNGGAYEDSRQGTRRYWITTTPGAEPG